MADPDKNAPPQMIVKNISGFKQPTRDGEDNEYIHPEAAKASDYFRWDRRVIFVNGMKNSREDHVVSALALSFVQMCPVVGVYNLSNGYVLDFFQCVADKRQYNGPSTWLSADIMKRRLLAENRITEEEALAALSRNKAQEALYHVLREHRSAEIFAHSQGNLILSNALQAIGAVHGQSELAGRVVHTFGSPTVNWPPGIAKFEHGFTFDPVNWLSGFDRSLSISKVGMPMGHINPLTHGFLHYLESDPRFVINRYRTGTFFATFSMDEAGLAQSLLAMSKNLWRVEGVFKHLHEYYLTDADDVALLYIQGLMQDAELAEHVRKSNTLRKLLVEILSSGVTFKDEQDAIDFMMSPAS